MLGRSHKTFQRDKIKKNAPALASCIRSPLEKQAVEKVENAKSFGCYRSLFLVSKSDQKLKPSNRSKHTKQIPKRDKFKMEITELVRVSLNQGGWV